MRRRPTSRSAATPRSARRTSPAGAGRPTSPPRSTRRSQNIPDRWLFLPIKEGNVKAAAFFGLMDATTDGAGPLARRGRSTRCSPPQQGDGERCVVPVADGAGGLPERAALGRRRRRRQDRRGPRPAVLRDRRRQRDRSSAAPAPTSSGPAAGSLDAWPANPDENKYAQVRDSNVETLLIGGDARLRDAAAVGDARAAPAPAERPPGRARRHRSHGRLLDLPARGRHAADQHVPRQRPGRHVALHARRGRLHAGGQPRHDREDHRSASCSGSRR